MRRCSMAKSCLDQYSRSQFKDLMFRRAQPFFYAFDLLWLGNNILDNSSVVSEKKARERSLSR